MIFSVNKYFLLIVFFITNSFAQDYLETQFNVAYGLFEKGDYFNATTEFKRLLFFDEQNKYSYSGNLLIGKCYKGGALLDEAIKYFSLAHKNSSNSEQYYQSQVEIIKCNILRRTISKAYQLINELENNSRFADKGYELIYWRGWAYIFADDWQSAANEFDKIDKNHELKLLSDKVAEEKYSGTLLVVASVILPGFGQFYTGHVLSGFLSLAWCGLFGYLSLNSFYAERAFDGVITTGLFLRFHRGNLQNVNNYINSENLEISNRALEFLQEKYTGPKP